jgi:hypothetical protein
MKRPACILLLALASACASASAPGGSAPAPEHEPSGVALIEVHRTLTAVEFGSGTRRTTRWAHPGAAAAPDGSAVFVASEMARVDERVVSRLEPATGHITGRWTVEGAPEVEAVAPGGRWVALTERSSSEDVTVLTVLDAERGTTRRQILRGDVEPEAFTLDGNHLFAIRRYEHHYRVELVDLVTGAQDQSRSRDKDLGGDMTGGVVASALTDDRTVLATLYRNPPHVPGHPGHEGSSPAFVHLADLQNKWTSCIDLPAPFGTGPEGDDVIATDDDDVVVGATASGAVARIDAGAIHTPDPARPMTAVLTDGGHLPHWPADVTTTAGFERFIAIVP